jgi:protein O-mannosyl-transferase
LLLNFSITKRKTAVFLLVLIGCLVFANTLQNDYNLDDGYYADGNSFTAGLKNIPNIVTNPTFFGSDKSGFDYRPVTAISFALEHQFFGDHPAVGHFFNLLLYLLSVILVFTLLLQLVSFDNKVEIAFWVSLLFLVHPLHTEVVASIKSRDEILSFLFAILSWKSAIKYSDSGKTRFVFSCILFFGLGMFSKYTLLPFCAIIPLSLYFFRGYDIRKAAFLFAIIFVFGLGFHFVKGLVLPASNHVFSVSENALTNPAYGWLERSATASYVLGRYLLLHLFPITLVCYYGCKYVPVVEWYNLVAIISLILHLFLVAYCFKNLRKKSLVVFGVVMYLAFMFVYSNLVELSPGMMAERFCYCSSLGFSIALVGYLFSISENPLRIRSPQVIFSVVALIFAVRTITRNSDWKDKQTLYSHDVQTADNSALVNYFYADWKLSTAIEQIRDLQKPSLVNRTSVQQINDRIKEAEYYFNRVLQINPNDSLADYSLITCAFQLGQFPEALTRANTTIQKYPTYWESYFMRGVIHSKLQQYSLAVDDLSTVVRNYPAYVPAYEQLNRALLQTGDTASALKLLTTAMVKFPKSPVAYAEMANYFLATGDTLRAIALTEKAAALPPINLAVLGFLSKYFKNKGDQVKFEYYDKLMHEQLQVK